MEDGGDDDDDGGVGVGKELVGAGGVELPTGSAEAFGTVVDVGGRRFGPRWAFSALLVLLSSALSSSSLAQPLSFGALYCGVVICARW